MAMDMVHEVTFDNWRIGSLGIIFIHTACLE